MTTCLRAAVTCLLALVVSLPAHAALKAWLDTDQAAPGDSVQLTLHRDGQSGGKPDLSPLKQTFDILATRSSTSIQIINGSTSAATDIVATISPKHAGKLTVPSITWGGDTSQPLTLVVATQPSGKAGDSDRSANAKVFLEATVDDRHPYVQAATQVTVRLYAAEALYHANLDLPVNNDTLVQQVGSDERSRVQRNGQSYDVLTRHYVIFPQRSGSLQLAAPVLQAEVADRKAGANPFGTDPFAGFFGNSSFSSMLTSTKPIRLHGESIELNVRPRPSGASAAYWLPAREVTLTSQWHPDPLRVRAGEPLTLDLHLRAAGLTAAQLPDLTKLIELPVGLKEYPDEAKLATAPQGTNVVGSRDQSVALIADEPGSFAIPPFKLSWWDTQSGQMREVTLPGRTVEVLPAVKSTADRPTGAPIPPTVIGDAREHLKVGREHVSPELPASSRSSQGELVWRLLAVASFLLWFASLAAWLLWSRRKAAATRNSQTNHESVRQRTSKARAAFRAACRRNDAQAARRCLLEWIEAARPDIRPSGLNALARATAEPALSSLLRELDRACYIGVQWSGDALLQALDELPWPPAVRAHNGSAQLASLYD
jgi:hypothetical protein